MRMASKPKSADPWVSETKDEKRERKRREREAQDARNRAYDLVLHSMPEYRRSERNFWIVIGVGMALAVVSLALTYFYGQQPDLGTWQGIATVVTLGGAYILIIGSFIYDLVRRRPYRKKAEVMVHSMSDKRMLELFEQDRAAQLEKRRQKEERRKK